MCMINVQKFFILEKFRKNSEKLWKNRKNSEKFGKSLKKFRKKTGIFGKIVKMDKRAGW